MMPILMVDDSREDLALASRVFLQCNIRNPVRLMYTGQECIDFFERGGDKPDWPLPCLVFLDLMMNPVSGIEVLRKVQNNPVARGSVFVMVSGASDYAMVREGYQLGATTFVTKPLRCDEVLRTLRSLRGVTLKPQSDGNVIVPAAPQTGASHERTSPSEGASRAIVL